MSDSEAFITDPVRMTLSRTGSTLIRELGAKPEIVTGHDFRSYSASVKTSLISGLLAALVLINGIALGADTPAPAWGTLELLQRTIDRKSVV